jgi:hypothetical protein
MAIGCGLPKKTLKCRSSQMRENEAPKHEAVKNILPSEVENISPFVQGFTHSELILCG